MRKILITFAVLTVVFAGLCIGGESVQASGGRYYSETNPEGFDGEEWERTRYYYDAEDDERVKFVFGYDIFMINEDYAWSYSYYANHKAGVENGNGPTWTSNALTGRWAKEEVTHKGDSVEYKFWVDDEEEYSKGNLEKSNMKF